MSPADDERQPSLGLDDPQFEELRRRLEKTELAQKAWVAERELRRLQERERHPVLYPLKRLGRATSFLAFHAACALLIIFLIAVVSWAILRVGGPTLFDRIPLAYIFDAMDLGIMAVFAFLGISEAIAVFKE